MTKGFYQQLHSGYLSKKMNKKKDSLQQGMKPQKINT